MLTWNQSINLRIVLLIWILPFEEQVDSLLPMEVVEEVQVVEVQLVVESVCNSFDGILS